METFDYDHYKATKNVNPKNIIMIIYEANRPGIVLIPTEMENDTFSEGGYLSNGELLDLIDLAIHPECVGVRIFNSCNPDLVIPNTMFTINSNRIVAVAVKADGFELTDKYLVSNDVDGSSNHLQAQLIRDRSLMKMNLESTFKGIAERLQFSSFFSREDILKLTDPDLSFSGVCFYNGNLRVTSRVEPRLRNMSGQIRTHLAVPSNVRTEGFLAGTIIRFNSENARNFILSDRPCPGHCPRITNVEEVNNGTASPIVEIGRSPATGLDTNNDPYIVKWEHGG